MYNRMVRVLSCMAVVLILAGYFSFAYAEYVPGEVLVKYRDGSMISESTLSEDAGIQQKKDFRAIRLHHMALPENMSVQEAIAIYQQDPNVEYAEPNYIVEINTIPDDTDFTGLWGMHNEGQTGGAVDADIDAPEAWELTVGSEDVIVAVVDTGVVYTHPDLSANIWTNSGETSCVDGIDNDGNGYIDDCNGWDFVGSDNDPTDYNGHGTHVAGTIAAVGNNADGVSGVMWRAKIMPLRFLGVNGTGTTADAVSAILYASANGAHVINNSWGGGGYSQALKDAIDASDTVVVCAAGNSGSNVESTPFYPASYTSSNIISVAATDHNDQLAAFSNYGITSVDIAAPGAGIYSTVPVIGYGAPVTVYSQQSFEGASGELPLLGWNRGGANSSWSVTSGTGTDGSNSLEDSPGADYSNSTGSWAGYMTPITSVKDNIYTLTFSWKGELENYFDYLDINYSLDGSSWDWVDYRTGSTSGDFESDSSEDLTSIAESYDEFYFGFGITADSSVTSEGVSIDDIELTRTPLRISSYGYSSYNGTSMAAPHVAGVAGLVKALHPEFSNLQIRSAIINSVDVKADLVGSIATGGRLNAYGALVETNIDVISDGSGDSETVVVPGSNSGIVEAAAGGGGGGGGCFIATAAYGSFMHPYVRDLREFRDDYLLSNYPGRLFVYMYYKYSPPVANIIKDSEGLRFASRILLAPVVAAVTMPYHVLTLMLAGGFIYMLRRRRVR